MLTYIVPFRRWRAEPVGELAAYLRGVARVADVIVVDGSAPELFAAHAAAFEGGVHTAAGHGVRHVPLDPSRQGRSGKVNGVLTGVGLARSELLVLADDDVRYDDAGLDRMAALLAGADLVRPQNHFSPLPWHARWDTARTLLNRAVAADYPGTLGVRRAALARTGGYDADVLFENLELIRTVQAAGGRVRHAPELFVRRVPPTIGQFVGQRVRQAYDSTATPVRLLLELSVVPLLCWAVVRRQWRTVGKAAGALVLIAERGRCRAGGAAVFPASSSLLAPLWVLERGVCSWLALGQRRRHGGVRYAGTTFARAATPRRALRRRFAAATVAGR